MTLPAIEVARAELTGQSSRTLPHPDEGTLSEATTPQIADSRTVQGSLASSSGTVTVMGGEAVLRVLPDWRRETFDRLADAWYSETAYLSSTQRIVISRHYQQIIGMGPLVVPHILRRLRDQGGYWFWALAAITRQDPAAGMVAYEDAREAWIEWGQEMGHIW